MKHFYPKIRLEQYGPFEILRDELEMGQWRESWTLVVWVILGILTFLSGYTSGSAVMMVVGVVLACGYASLYLTSLVPSDHIVKRALEVVFMLLAFGVNVYGYIVTRSLILGVTTIFIITVIFVAFVISYFLPRIRSGPSSYG